MYIDPTFGGILIQLAVVLVATCGAVVFAMRRKIKSFFSKTKNDISNVGDTVDSANIASDGDAVDMLADDDNINKNG